MASYALQTPPLVAHASRLGQKKFPSRVEGGEVSATCVLCLSQGQAFKKNPDIHSIFPNCQIWKQLHISCLYINRKMDKNGQVGSKKISSNGWAVCMHSYTIWKFKMVKMMAKCKYEVG